MQSNNQNNQPVQNKLVFVNIRGMVIPVKEEEYNEFVENLQEWDN